MHKPSRIWSGSGGFRIEQQLVRARETMTEKNERLTRRRVPSQEIILKQNKLPAWLLSLLLHFSLLATIAALWTSRPHGTGAEIGGPVGIAVVHQRFGEEEYLLSDEPDSTEVSPDQSLAGLPSVSSAEQSQEELLKGLMPHLDPGAGAAASGDSGLGTGSASLPTGGKTSGVKAKLFGIEGEGNRFVYVIDRSDSMNGFEGKPMLRAKAELIDSLEALGPTHQFQVIFYNDTPVPFGGSGGGGPQLLRGEKRSKELAQRFIRETPAVGGTNHVDALRMALAMGPDIVFFLTDGDFPKPAAPALDNILTRAARNGTTIHCIQFGEGNRNVQSSWINRLAEDSGGQYRYEDVSQF